MWKFMCPQLLLLALSVVASPALPQSRIVGGYEATLGQFPHQISLRKEQLHKCGGSIISSTFVLTAGHCVVEIGTRPYNASLFTIRAGTHNRIAGGVIIQVKRIIVHEKYEPLNDLALLELQEKLIFSEFIQPIELATDEVPPAAQVIISGWGILKEGAANIPIMLQWHQMTAISKLSCATKIVYYSDALLCLDHPMDAGGCNGDSGGPAVYEGKLVGVASFVINYCGGPYPDGFNKVSYHIDWIRDNMNKEFL